MNDEFRINYDQEAVKRKTENSIREESYSKGIEQGTKESKIEIAKNMLKKEMDITLISDLTSLSIDEINELNKYN